MAENNKIDRLPGRLVVTSLILLYLGFGFGAAGFATGGLGDLFSALSGLCSLLVLPLILFAIILRIIDK
jgi:hypothetical protein